MIHGIRPGPELFQKQGTFVAALFIGLLVANLLVLPIGLLGAKLFAQTVRAPKHFLLPFIVVLSVVGSYAINNSLFDVAVMFAFGLIGWTMRRFDFPAAPLVLGLILGKMAEENLRRALILSEGQLAIFLTRPIAFLLLSGAILSIVFGIWQQRRIERKLFQS
ncbi:MAG: tripartite tricarboxylate transporter permease [Armatimonadota bacterium]|nr:tripartite tricarboxylate transporter permease [Armatimonadota bacterium]